MIAVDTNLLVYAHRQDSPWHEAAKRSLRDLAESGSAWAIPWPCIHEFLAIATHPRIYRPPTPLRQALLQVEYWMESPTLQIIGELQSHWQELKAVMQSGKITGARTHDARIVAICRQHGIRILWSADRDLSRFAGIRVVNPTVLNPET